MKESNELIRLYELKKDIKEQLETILSNDSIRKASKDSHAYRRPRPCGITIHPGHGCVFECVYCYIYDMGFPKGRVNPYPLSSLELVYALTINPYIVPERTLAAYGSVTEPLLPTLKVKTLSYIREVWRWLKLPSQISTKGYIDEGLAKELKNAEPNLSVLVTVITIKFSRILEPKAPDPKLRFKGALNASKQGLRVDLFLRPIIPGIAEKEYRDILNLAVKHGIKGVVVGSLRITANILKNLENVGISINNIVSRVQGINPFRLKGSRQVSITTSDIKELIRKYAVRLGLDFMQSACSANIIAHGLGCKLCKFGPCGKSFMYIKEERIKEFLEFLGLRNFKIDVKHNLVKVLLGDGRIDRKWLQYYISEVYKLPVSVK